MSELKKLFRPEFLNRLDEIIVFKKLTEESVEKITRLMLKEFEDRVKAKDMNITITDAVVKHIAKVGFDSTYGARPLRRAIQSKIEDLFAEAILDKQVQSGDTVKMDLKDDKIIIEKVK